MFRIKLIACILLLTVTLANANTLSIDTSLLTETNYHKTAVGVDIDYDAVEANIDYADTTSYQLSSYRVNVDSDLTDTVSVFLFTSNRHMETKTGRLFTSIRQINGLGAAYTPLWLSNGDIFPYKHVFSLAGVDDRDRGLFPSFRYKLKGRVGKVSFKAVTFILPHSRDFALDVRYEIGKVMYIAYTYKSEVVADDLFYRESFKLGGRVGF